MSTGAVAPSSKWQLWLGRVLSALPTLMFIFSASMKLMQQPKMVASFTNELGFPAGVLVPIGVLELACLALYLVPQTSVLGAVLLTGYLGGAVVTHLRVGQPFLMPVLIGVFVWGGLYLRDMRLRALLPLRKPAGG
jgi:hypothetical protein